ncbi:hypothetical protein EVAR_88323_1 [Eumeta japonica]|uniref:Uncharacterized protein n=1 Tax=Eumeta variegata TaxID=151549 RepID=A0A4C1VMF7_EUMVA|nr:hypothetical protein EVAR_88323_1 [Eumeta japonica]
MAPTFVLIKVPTESRRHYQCRREIEASVFAFRPVSDSSGGPIPPLLPHSHLHQLTLSSITPLPFPLVRSHFIRPQPYLSDSIPIRKVGNALVTPLWLRACLLFDGSHAFSP